MQPGVNFPTCRFIQFRSINTVHSSNTVRACPRSSEYGDTPLYYTVKELFDLQCCFSNAISEIEVLHH